MTDNQLPIQKIPERVKRALTAYACAALKHAAPGGGSYLKEVVPFIDALDSEILDFANEAGSSQKAQGDREGYSRAVNDCIIKADGVKWCNPKDNYEFGENTGIERAKNEMRSLLQPEPPKTDPLETGIASLETALEQKLNNGEICYTPALAEDELVAILKALEGFSHPPGVQTWVSDSAAGMEPSPAETALQKIDKALSAEREEDQRLSRIGFTEDELKALSELRRNDRVPHWHVSNHPSDVETTLTTTAAPQPVSGVEAKPSHGRTDRELGDMVWEKYLADARLVRDTVRDGTEVRATVSAVLSGLIDGAAEYRGKYLTLKDRIQKILDMDGDAVKPLYVKLFPGKEYPLFNTAKVALIREEIAK